MKLSVAIDRFIADWQAQGRIRSDRTVRSYLGALLELADDVQNRDPSLIGRDDIMRTLARWKQPNTRANRQAIFRSFFDWAMEEGLRKDNPARQIRRPKRLPTTVYRLTHGEAVAMLEACRTTRERRAIYLGICAGLRNQELRGLRGRHFQRPGWVWVDRDIAKGGKQRWVPVLSDLEPVVEEIRSNVGLDEFVLPAQRFRDVGANTTKIDKRKHPSSAQALYYLVQRVGQRAGIAAHVHPHLLRHAFGDHIARFAGMRNAQFLLGHATIGTTETYVGQPTLDELRASIVGFSFGSGGLPPTDTPARPVKATTGIEPVEAASRLVERFAEITLRFYLSPVLQEAARRMA